MLVFVRRFIVETDVPDDSILVSNTEHRVSKKLPKANFGVLIYSAADFAAVLHYNLYSSPYRVNGD